MKSKKEIKSNDVKIIRSQSWIISFSKSHPFNLIKTNRWSQRMKFKFNNAKIIRSQN